MGIAFIGYVLPFGQMSFWDGTVITNLLSYFPSIIEFVCGGYYVYNPILKRFFIFHFLFPFLKISFIILHIFNLHFLSSNNPLSKCQLNNKIPFLPFIISKDFYGNILILYLYFLLIYFGFSSFSHTDNALEACGLLTPLHIVPEWYFLCQYAMLKAVPNKRNRILAGHEQHADDKESEFYSLRSCNVTPEDLSFVTASPTPCKHRLLVAGECEQCLQDRQLMGYRLGFFFFYLQQSMVEYLTDNQIFTR